MPLTCDSCGRQSTTFFGNEKHLCSQCYLKEYEKKEGKK